MNKIIPLLSTCTLIAAAGCSQQNVPGPGPAIKGPVVTAYSLKWVDIKQGDGAPAEQGATLTVHYIGWLDDGTQFTSSYEKNDPLTFEYGAGKVKPGWDAGGLDGMRVGSKRRIIIPPQLAYGHKGRAPIIPPDSRLTFDVELIKVEPPAAPAPAEPAAATTDSAQPSQTPAPDAVKDKK